jgi:hypothetical protein
MNGMVPSITAWCLVYAVWSSCLSSVVTQCPNDCSLKGYCNKEGTCMCDELYQVAADCSLSTISSLSVLRL